MIRCRVLCSYTTFNFTRLEVASPNHLAPDTITTVSVKITNTGPVAGTEVAQVYCQDPIMRFTRPWKRLLAFSRVALQPGASATVEIPISRDELMFHDDEMVRRLVPGEYTLSVGGSSYSAAALTAALVL